MIKDALPAPLTPSTLSLGGLGEIVRLVLGDGLTDALPFSAGTGLEALFDRVEAGR